MGPRPMNYELFMRAALAEAALAAGGGRARGRGGRCARRGDGRADPRGRPRSGDPTAHAVMALLREASRRWVAVAGSRG